ncbi:MAG TPA: M56 family metallopeptidase [Thermoanaerobaculia bacterium]
MFDSPLVTAWLLTYALHSTLFLGLAWMTSRWLAKRMPAVEEAAWRFALIAGLITASLQIAAGHEPLAGRWDLARTEVPASSRASEPLLLASSPRQAAPAERPAVLSGTTGAASAGPSLPAMPRLSAAAFLAGIWAFCALLLAARWAGVRLLLRRRLRPRPEVVEGTMVSLLLRLVGQAGLPWAVRLSCSSRLPVPVALGVRRPEICVPPRSLVGLAPEEQEGMLAHELAHLVRRDPFWLAFSQLVASVLFFQPLNWVACRRMREISELLCDEWAVGRTGRPVSLARCLAEVAGWSLHPTGPLAVPSMADRPSNLSHRIRRLLDEARSPERKIRPAWLAAGMIALLFAVAAAAPGVSAVVGDEAKPAVAGGPRAEDEEPPTLASEEPLEDAETPTESELADLQAELAEIDQEIQAELGDVDVEPDLDLDLDIDPDIDIDIDPEVDFDFDYDFDVDAAGFDTTAVMADFELSPEEEAALDALADRYGKLAEDMAARMEPRMEEMQRKLDEELSKLQDSGEMAKLTAEMEAIAERARPSEEEMERLHDEAEKLRAKGGLSAEERARIRAEAKRLADQHRLSEEDRARIRDLQRQSREVHERFMREHRDEIEKIRRDALEQSRLIHEEVQRQLQNDPELRKLRERSLRDRDREKQERREKRQKDRDQDRDKDKDKDKGESRERQVRVEVDPQVRVQVAAAPTPEPQIRVEVAPQVQVKEAKAKAEAKIEAKVEAKAEPKAEAKVEIAEPPL